LESNGSSFTVTNILYLSLTFYKVSNSFFAFNIHVVLQSMQLELREVEKYQQGSQNLSHISIDKIQTRTLQSLYSLH
jgi:hypothetical protein